jgi:hypothetical protein
MPGRRGPGRKANLDPRVPAARMLPKLGKWAVKELSGGKKRRVFVEHQDFATPDVIAALEAAGMKLPASNFDREWTLHDLKNDLYHVVAHYISDAEYQQAPKKFRSGVKTFHKAMSALMAKFPGPGTELAGALNDEIEKLDSEDAQDIELCRVVVLALLEASERILADEAGRGADADRAKRLLIAGLAAIYEERTGRAPKGGWDPINEKPDGPFFRFVAAVNKLIPARFRISDIDSLVRAHLDQ